MKMRYAEVILPLALESSYTYSIPAAMESSITVGCRVVVHFGKRHYYTALVIGVTDRKPNSEYEIKEIYALLDSKPIVRDSQLQFWKWIASYYICKLGEVYKVALPSGLKPESETTVVLNSDFESGVSLPSNEQLLLDVFGKDEKMTVLELERRTGLKNILPIVTSLIARGAVCVSEDLKRKFTPKTETYVKLETPYEGENTVKAFDLLKRAEKQEQILLSYIELSSFAPYSSEIGISKNVLLNKSGCSIAALNGLIKRGILKSYPKEIGRLNLSKGEMLPLKTLSDEQQAACQSIKEVFLDKEVCLLHGVTSSGKTEVYMHLIQEVLDSGKQALFLLPEIAITTQITDRLSRFFGDRLLVYHSRFSDNERVEVWNKLLHAERPYLVLGVRSSLFLPFHNLGLIVVDEEHEPSFKQQDPAPRYSARNAAVVLGNIHGAKILLGSATPSIETYYNAQIGKYGLVELKKRYGGCLMPSIIPVDVKEEKRRKIMKHSLFSPLLLEKMTQALSDEKGQVILFQNRRGFAPMMECRECGWVPKCVNCDVSLTYHKFHNQLVCHYCGHVEMMPQVCPACGSEKLHAGGVGTEKVEEMVQELFPGVGTDRLDTDTTRTKTAYERILSNFKSGKSRILIGTQMITKGLDFENVRVVGILDADALMNYPDFRAYERAYQLMVQVSGRAGRRKDPGVVVLQTKQTDHPLLQTVYTMDYQAMAQMQMSERRLFKYPPYYRLIHLTLRSRDFRLLSEVSTVYAGKLRKKFGDRVLGPVAPPIGRIQLYYIKMILLKLEVNSSVSIVRKHLEAVYEEMQSECGFTKILLHYDVDPLN